MLKLCCCVDYLKLCFVALMLLYDCSYWHISIRNQDGWDVGEEEENRCDEGCAPKAHVCNKIGPIVEKVDV